jgi:hypothetical protein
MNDFYSGKPFGIAIFDPMELGWVCPIDKSHRIDWSEFNCHVWCYECRKDYFTLLCPKQMNPFTTPKILKEETGKLQSEMDKWTMARYKKESNIKNWIKGENNENIQHGR